jgi:hypothetical protein
LVFYKKAPDKIAPGIDILLKFKPENEEFYKLAKVIAAAALFEIDLFVLL